MSKPIFEDLFTFTTGRRNRKSFIFHGLIVTINWLIMSIGVMSLYYLHKMGDAISQSSATFYTLTAIIFLTISSILSIPIFISSCAVMTQRCRDINISGKFVILFMILGALIPFLSLAIYLFFCCKKGTDGNNRFGDDPLKVISPISN